MNRNALKIPAILICVTFVMLLCCACGSGDQSGYEEREISLPEGGRQQHMGFQCGRRWGYADRRHGRRNPERLCMGKQKPRASWEQVGVIRMLCISRSLKKWIVRFLFLQRAMQYVRCRIALWTNLSAWIQGVSIWILRVMQRNCLTLCRGQKCRRRFTSETDFLTVPGS